MSDEKTNSILQALTQQKRKDYQAQLEKEISSNFTDAEARAIMVKSMILLVEEHLSPDVKDELLFLHLKFKQYNQPQETESVA